MSDIGINKGPTELPWRDPVDHQPDLGEIYVMDRSGHRSSFKWGQTPAELEMAKKTFDDYRIRRAVAGNIASGDGRAAASGMTNPEALRLMRAIGDMAAVIYPQDHDSELDSRLAMAFGVIRGFTIEAVAAVEQNRKLRLPGAG